MKDNNLYMLYNIMHSTFYICGNVIGGVFADEGLEWN